VKTRGFTIIELLVVVGIIAVLASILFPVLLAHLEQAKVTRMRAQFQQIESALEKYHGRWGAYPPSTGGEDNGGVEALLEHLRAAGDGGPCILERRIAGWVEDTDGDGRAELVDPWRGPWVYFCSTNYDQGVVHYILRGRRIAAEPAREGEAYANPTSYQLWACGPNQTNESGQGDDVGNLRK